MNFKFGGINYWYCSSDIFGIWVCMYIKGTTLILFVCLHTLRQIDGGREVLANNCCGPLILTEEVVGYALFNFLK